MLFNVYNALHCRLHTEIAKTMFGFVCLLQTLLDCHASGPDLSALGILNLSHPTLTAGNAHDIVSGSVTSRFGEVTVQYIQTRFRNFVVQTAVQNTVSAASRVQHRQRDTPPTHLEVPNGSLISNYVPRILLDCFRKISAFCHISPSGRLR